MNARTHTTHTHTLAQDAGGNFIDGRGLLTGSYSSVAANEVFSPEGGDFVNVAINMNGDPAKAKQAMLSVLRQVGPASSGAGWRL